MVDTECLNNGPMTMEDKKSLISQMKIKKRKQVLRKSEVTDYDSTAESKVADINDKSSTAREIEEAANISSKSIDDIKLPNRKYIILYGKIDKQYDSNEERIAVEGDNIGIRFKNQKHCDYWVIHNPKLFSQKHPPTGILKNQTTNTFQLNPSYAYSESNSVLL